jgi:hypothetical protein
MQYRFLFLFSVFFFYIGSVKTQTLVFKRAILVESLTETVPSSHVWKVTSVNVANPVAVDANNAGSSNLGNGNRYCITINSSSICGGSSSMTSTSSSNVSGVRFYRDVFHGPLQMPIWLPAGSTISTSTGTQLISVLEFELIP